MKRIDVGGLSALAGTWPPTGGRPTLLCIHGSGGAAVLWQHQVDALAHCANTLAVDLPGHGLSSGPGFSSVSDYARVIAELVISAGLSQVVCCGLSLGGAIALELLLDHAKLFSAGILCSTGARLKVMPAILETVRNDYGAFIASLNQWTISPATQPARVAPLLAATAACAPTVTEGDFRACDAFDVRARLGEITAPVLLVSSGDDVLTPPKYADYLGQHLAGARRVHIDGAGHLTPMEQPERFNAAVEDFLGTQVRSP